MVYLLDTNTASFAIRAKPARVVERIEAAVARLAVSVITEAELRYGIARRPELAKLPEALEKFLARVDVLEWDRAAARQYGRLRSSQEMRGESLGPLDMLIAAHALALGAVLVTSDRALLRVPDLRTEDWTG